MNQLEDEVKTLEWVMSRLLSRQMIPTTHLEQRLSNLVESLQTIPPECTDLMERFSSKVAKMLGMFSNLKPSIVVNYCLLPPVATSTGLDSTVDDEDFDRSTSEASIDHWDEIALDTLKHQLQSIDSTILLLFALNSPPIFLLQQKISQLAQTVDLIPNDCEVHDQWACKVATWLDRFEATICQSPEKPRQECVNEDDSNLPQNQSSLISSQFTNHQISCENIENFLSNLPKKLASLEEDIVRLTMMLQMITSQQSSHSLVMALLEVKVVNLSELMNEISTDSSVGLELLAKWNKKMAKLVCSIVKAASTLSTLPTCVNDQSTISYNTEYSFEYTLQENDQDYCPLPRSASHEQLRQWLSFDSE